MARSRWARASARRRDPAQLLAPHELGAALGERVADVDRGLDRAGEVRVGAVVVVGERTRVPARARGSVSSRAGRRRRAARSTVVRLVAPPGLVQRLDPLRLPADQPPPDRETATIWR